MNNADLVLSIEQAKNADGVITASTLHSQLNTLTAADWKEASVIYSKNSVASDGFYINDDAHGDVTIHNDLTRAQKIADTSVGQLTLNDGKGIVEGALGLETIASLSWGVTAAAMAPVEGATLSGVLGIGAVATGTAALYAGAAIAVLSAGVAAVDLGRNSIRQSTAQDEVRTSQTLSLHS